MSVILSFHIFVFIFFLSNKISLQGFRRDGTNLRMCTRPIIAYNRLHSLQTFYLHFKRFYNIDIINVIETTFDLIFRSFKLFF